MDPSNHVLRLEKDKQMYKNHVAGRRASIDWIASQSPAGVLWVAKAKIKRHTQWPARLSVAGFPSNELYTRHASRASDWEA